MDLYKEAQDIAREALKNAEGCFDTAYDYLRNCRWSRGSDLLRSSYSLVLFRE